MDNLTNEDKKILFDMFEVDEEIFNNLKKIDQNRLIHILLILHEYKSFSDEFQNNGWDTNKIRAGLKILRSAKRKILEYKKIKNNISEDLNHFEEYVISEIEELNDLYQEVIAQKHKQEISINNTEPEESIGDMISGFFSTLMHGLKWYIIVMFFLIVLFLILAPTHIYPMIGNCRNNEGISDCYFRIQAERIRLQRFTECQDACGRGIGNEICLENCEYKYGMNKYQYIPQ